MLGAILWAALSIFSFAVFFALPSVPSGADYFVLVPAFLSLTASVLLAPQFRANSTRKLVNCAPSLFDEIVVARTEKQRQNKQEEEARMLRDQSSRRRAARRL